MTIFVGDVREQLRTLPAESVHCVVTSPPYWSLRSYSTSPQLWGGSPDCDHEWLEPVIAKGITGGTNQGGKIDNPNGVTYRPVPPTESSTCRHCGAWRGELGGEPTPELYVEHIVEVFREVRRVLRRDGTCWVNLGDSYATQPAGNFGPNMPKPANGGAYRANKPKTDWKVAGLKPKDLVGIPWRVAFALQADGWYLRSDVIWSKPNPMPESVTDRPTRSHEYLFLLAKSSKYYYDAEAIRDPAQDWGLRDRSSAKHNAEGYAGGALTPHKGFTNGNAAAIGRNKRTVWEIPTMPFSARALGDGTFDKVSPDCAIHGDSDLARTARRQARDDALRAIDWPRILGTDAYRVQAPEAESVSNSSLNSDSDSVSTSVLTHTSDSTELSKTPTVAYSSDGHHAVVETTDHTSHIADQGEQMAGSSDLTDLSRSETATSHNTQIHRTDPDLSTSPPYTPFAETSGHIDGRLMLPGFDELSARTPESKTEPGGSVARLAVQTTIDSVHRLSCTCSIPDHFATYPEKLVEPCILAGTSERGVCRECGAPWARTIEKTYRSAIQTTGTEAGRYENGRNRNVLRMGDGVDSVTTGWQPSCKHAGDPVPATVLDIFLGSGTTARVAERLGRRWIGIELSESYAAIARRRTAQMSLTTWATEAAGD